MEYGSMIREAWSTTWHHRFLWILGLFTGAALGTCSGVGSNGSQLQYRFEPGELRQTIPELEGAATATGAWVMAHPVFVGGAILSAVALGIALLIVSFIAQGGMTEATIDLARHQPASFGRAWHEGQHLFWRFVGIALVPILIALVLALVIGIFVAMAIGTSSLAAAEARGAVIALWVLLGLIVGLLAIPFAIGVTIVLSYAQRAVVVENVGPIAAIRSGWQVMRTHLGSSLVVWLVNFGLSIAANLAIVIATLLVAAILAAVGALLWNLVGFTAITAIYIAFAVIVTIGMFWGLEAVANTFFWNYWTLAYLRLTGAISVRH